MNHSPETDRRAWRRHSCELSAFCRVLGDGTRLAWPAQIRDISIGGLCLQTSRCYEPSVFLAVEPGDNTTVPWSTRLVRVLHARRPEEGSGWLFGCSFVSQISNDELLWCRTAPKSGPPLDIKPQGSDTNGGTEPETP